MKRKSGGQPKSGGSFQKRLTKNRYASIKRARRRAARRMPPSQPGAADSTSPGGVVAGSHPISLMVLLVTKTLTKIILTHGAAAADDSSAGACRQESLRLQFLQYRDGRLEIYVPRLPHQLSQPLYILQLIHVERCRKGPH